MAEVENLVLDHLRHIRGQLDRMENDIREIKGRLGRLDADLPQIRASKNGSILSQDNYLRSI